MPDLEQEHKGLLKSRKQWMGWLSIERQTHAQRMPTLPPHLISSSAKLPTFRNSMMLQSTMLTLPTDIKGEMSDSQTVHFHQW